MRIYKISVNKSTVKEVLENYSPRFNDIFGDKKRILISMEQGWIKETLSKLRNGETKTGSKYKIDPSLNYAYKEGDKSNRPFKIGKIIQLELGKDYLNEWSRQKEHISNQGQYSILISRSPIDIVRMSDFYETHSCHAPNREYFACAKQEAMEGGAIAYLVNSSKLQGLTDEDLQGDDLFFDKGRSSGKDGLAPDARLRINRYINEEDEEIAVPLDSMYGLKLKPFYDTVSEFLYNKQQDKLNQIKENKDTLKGYKRIGGTYRDLNDNTIMDDFFKEEMGLKGNLDTESNAEIQIQQWQEEVGTAIADFDERMKVFDNVVAEIYADVYADDGVPDAALSILASGEITVFADVDLGNIEELFGEKHDDGRHKGEYALDLDSLIHEIRWRDGLSAEEGENAAKISKYLDKFGILLKKLEEAFESITQGGITNTTITVKQDNGLEITFKFDFEAVDNPDDFSRTLASLQESIVKNYYNFSSTVLNELSSSKIISGHTNAQDDQYLSLLDQNMFLCQIPQSANALSKDIYTAVGKSTELVNSLYDEFHKSIVDILVNVYNKKNQMTFDFFEDTKARAYSKKIPDFILYIDEYPVYRYRDVGIQVFRYFDWNEHAIKLLIPSSEVYNVGKEAMRNFLKYMPLIAKNFKPKCDNIFKNFINVVNTSKNPTNTEKDKEPVTANTWFGIYKQSNINENKMIFNSDLTVEESEIAIDIINTCIDQEGFFDKNLAIAKIKQNNIDSSLLIEKIINEVNKNRPITPKMIERVKMKTSSNEIIGPEIAKWISEYYDLPEDKSWELAGLATK